MVIPANVQRFRRRTAIRRSNRRTTQAYKDALYLTDNWIAVAGIRYQYYTQYAGKGRPFNVNTDSRDEQWTPKLGLVYKLTPSVSLFAIIRKHLCRSRQLPATLAIFHQNHLMLTKSGKDQALFDGITADIALFDIHKRNVLYTESIGDETIAKTAGRVRSRGVEVDLAGALTENINIIASYGYTDAKVLEDPDYAGKPLPNVPRHTGSHYS
ncbi:TonB-dependent receptor domain-containing protein [Escherichia coli]